jgi:hypothetical protein
MIRVATAVLAAIALAGPTASLAGGKASEPSHPLPSSYAPGPHTGQHVYGSPIETHGVDQAQAPRHKHATAKQPAKPQKHDPRDHKAQNGRPPVGSQQGPG